MKLRRFCKKTIFFVLLLLLWNKDAGLLFIGGCRFEKCLKRLGSLRSSSKENGPRWRTRLGIIVWANSLVAMATEGAAIWGGNDGDAVGSFSSW